MRFYGANKTIHRTGHVDVEVDENGQVVAVWFRCQALAFKQSNVDSERAKEMKNMYDADELPDIVGFRLKDKV